ncbi:MAG: TIGR02281 family clan AA aspartic protease [Gammaproteobacteria bacterium]|nr:TIGR02281 family clan AA aspartic protease [Gammaproteobacteria bacterium]
MIIAAWALLLGLLTWLFQGRLEQLDNPNAQLQADSVNGSANGPAGAQAAAELRLKRDRAGHYRAPGRINGQPVQFLLDTGATHVALPEALADRLALKRGVRIQSHTANGTVSAWRTELDEVRLGSIVKNRVSGVIMPNMPGEQVLLGMSFLRSLELVQRDGELILRP